MTMIFLVIAQVAETERLTEYREQLHRNGILRDLEVDGYRYTLTDQGEGSVLVLLQGLGGSLYDWRHLAPRLAENFRVIALDVLGAGESDKPADADYSLAAQTRRLRGILDELKVEKATLVGNSYGGGIALFFAQDWPERVDRLVLIAPVCYPEKMPAYVRLFRIPVLPELVAPYLPSDKIARSVISSCYADAGRLSEEEIKTYCREVRAEGRVAAVIRTVGTLVAGDARERVLRYAKIQTPTLIVWGKHDTVLPLEHGERLAKDLPNAKLVRLNAGHVPNQERPKKVLQILKDFLR